MFIHAKCANSAGVQANSVDVAEAASANASGHETSNSINNAQNRMADLLITAMSLVGVNYKFGGNTPATGFDCSGFVRHLFMSSLAIELPRAAIQMSKRGLKVARDQLQAGDLVFYNTRRFAYSHVGIYIGEGRFIHAPSRGKSVEIIDMDDRYWRARFNGARRLLNLPQTDSAGEAINTVEARDVMDPSKSIAPKNGNAVQN